MNRVELKINHLVKTNNVAEFHGKNVSYIEQYLMSLGIEKKNLISFIDRPKDDDLDNPRNLLNIEKAVKTAWAALMRGDKAFVIVDSDTDGYTSASILINYLKRRFPGVDIQ